MTTANKSEHLELLVSMCCMSHVCPSTSYSFIIFSPFRFVEILLTVFIFRSTGTFTRPLIRDCAPSVCMNTAAKELVLGRFKIQNSHSEPKDPIVISHYLKDMLVLYQYNTI